MVDVPGCQPRDRGGSGDQRREGALAPENEGFNTQKNSGLNLGHAYSHTCWAAYYFLLQIAHLLLQLVEKGSLLRHLAREQGKRTAVELFGSLKNMAKRLLESLRYRHWPDEGSTSREPARSRYGWTPARPRRWRVGEFPVRPGSSGSGRSGLEAPFEPVAPSCHFRPWVGPAKPLDQPRPAYEVPDSSGPIPHRDAGMLTLHLSPRRSSGICISAHRIRGSLPRA